MQNFIFNVVIVSVLITACSGEDNTNPTVYPIVPIPTNTEHFKSASPGASGTFAIRQDGSLWGCGPNNLRLLGPGLPADQFSLPLQIGSDRDWKSVNSLGFLFAMAIKDDNSLWAWGRTEGMTTGINTITPLDSPTRVGTENNWETVKCSAHQTVALKTDGSMWGVGQGLNLGQGEFSGVISEFTKLNTAIWKDVAVGTSHLIAIRADGTLWATGWNNHGQLGNGTLTPDYSFQQIGTENDWKSCFVSGAKSMAIKNDGSLWAWGHNNNGHLGFGNTSDVLVPTRVGSAIWKSIGGDSVSTFGVQQDGTLWGWGDLIRQEFNVTIQQSYSPVRLSTSADWDMVYEGAMLIARKQNGTHWCCGNYLMLGFSDVSINPLRPMLWN